MADLSMLDSGFFARPLYASLPDSFKNLLLGKMPVEEPSDYSGYYKYHGWNYDPEYRASYPLDGLRYNDDTCITSPRVPAF